MSSPRSHLQRISLLLAIIIATIELQTSVASSQDLQTNSSQNLSQHDAQLNGRSNEPATTSLESKQNAQPIKQESRAGRMLDLDRLVGELGTQVATPIGGRQSRKLSAELGPATSGEERSRKGAKKMSIKGFIPIVSLEATKDASKQLESLAEHFSASSEADGAEEQSEQNEREQGGHHLREQLVSQFGAQTSLGHASFAPQQQLQQPQQSQSQPQFAANSAEPQWQQPGEPQESGRAKRLLASTLFANHKLGHLRPVHSSGFASNLVAQNPWLGGQNQLGGPMNSPQFHLLGQASQQQQQQALVALGAEQQQQQQQTPGEQCICVPFFQCKGGFLSESQLSRSQLGQLGAIGGQVPRSLAQPQQQQQQIASQPNDQQMVNDIYEQLRKNIESQNLERELLQQQQQQQLALIDERQARPAQSNGTSEPEERALLSAMSRRQSFAPTLSSTRQCGIMRTCCRVPVALMASQGARPPGFQQQQQQHAARLLQRPTQPQYQLLSPNRLQAAQLNLQTAYGSQPMSPEQAGDFLASQQAASFLGHEQQQAGPIVVGSASRPAGQFMAGRCGARQALGIAGRVQNSALQPGEQSGADFGEFPAHAAILRRLGPGDNLFVCSAVLVSSQWLATAAHCVRKLRADELTVRLGEWDVGRDDEFYPHVQVNVRELLLHPEFQASSLANDVALLRLEQPVSGSEMPHIAPACLAQPDEQFAGQRCWLAGWGKDAFGQAGSFQAQLRKVDLPVVGKHECELALRHHTKLGKYFRLHASSVCAGGERGKDACEGDGGAGLYCVDPASGLSKALGLVSWGVGCGQRGVPGVYASLAHLSPWIEQTIANSGEEDLYSAPLTGSDALGGRQQQAAPFRSLISERSNANATLVADAPNTSDSASRNAEALPTTPTSDNAN